MSRIHPSGVRRVLADVMEMTRLQGRLMWIDSREAAKRLVVAIVLACAAVAMAISAFTVLLLGASWLLSDQAGWTLGPSMLLVAGIAIVAIVLTLVAAYASIKRAASALSDSAEELGENVRWLQTALAPPATNGRAYSEHAMHQARGRPGPAAAGRRSRRSRRGSR